MVKPGKGVVLSGAIGYPAKFFFISLLFFLIFGIFSPLRAADMEPFSSFEISRDAFSVGFSREEHPSFYWLSAGVPDSFFRNVALVPGATRAVSIRSVEYDFQAGAWLTDQWQLHLTMPFEANDLTDSEGNDHNLDKFGDLELGSVFLLVGKREKGSYVGVEGSLRFPTGTNPFSQTFPLLSTGKGVWAETMGVLMKEEVGGFSFFQEINYETSQSVFVVPSDPLLNPGLFQWPDNIHAVGRIEWLALHRAQRSFSLFGQIRMRMSGLMKLNQEAIPYGQGLFTDRLFFATGGFSTRVDKDFSVEGEISYFPVDLSGARPASGVLFSVSLLFRPI